jgi:hypothetical protein
LDPDWNHYSIDVMKKHKFLTDTEIKERDKKKKENLEKLEKRLDEER